MNHDKLIERLAESVGGRERLAGFFSARTMGDLGRRADMELSDGAGTILDAVERSEKAIAAAGLQDYWTGPDALVRVLVRLWTAYQNAGSRTANWMVTGRSNFPVARNQKRMNAEHNAYERFAEVAAKAPERSVRVARASQKARIGVGGLADLELDGLRKRLDERQKVQAHMTAINKLIRKHKLGNKRDDAPADAIRLTELAADEGLSMSPRVAELLLTPDWGKPGYAAYQFSNNNAEIHRLQDRVAQVEAKIERIENAPEEAPEREVNGVKVIEDQGDDRLRLVFPGKPERAVIQLLKSSGFRWSPTNGAWQRQLTQNARNSANWVLNQINKEAA